MTLEWLQVDLDALDIEGHYIGDNSLFAMGGGVCFAKAIAFGVGARADQPLAHAYITAGLSVTDLAKLAF